ncbi:hypothetical protein LTR56_003143 [Elasticomyces elasticus]|nr:hypothetical protein LTR22_010676 [Elasticomyces elasticus]KAK3656012.1 hypothetical protein LTR56_003143 [Elasticomyces elasticus]KAK4920926.1 hypothetical protein LTR49_011649 [Elasticomyces elasticus]KAK5759558.1 hypothetical protein LTS12_010250 [Elasticomyces elasticus]
MSNTYARPCGLYPPNFCLTCKAVECVRKTDQQGHKRRHQDDGRDPRPPAKRPRSKQHTQITVAIDEGTTTSAVILAVDVPGKERVLVPMAFDRKFTVPQKAAWVNVQGEVDARFYLGYKVEDEVKFGRIKPDDVIEMWKLLLYKNFAESESAQRLIKQLRGRSVDSLLEERFSHFHADLTAWAKTIAPLARFTDEEFDHMWQAKKLIMGVPELWTPPATKRLTSAARKAGFGIVSAVSETVCAAAFYAQSLAHLPRYFKLNDYLGVFDLGGGTGDFATHQIASDSSQGAKTLLVRVGQAEGRMCGSVFINEHCMNWLRGEARREFPKGGFEALCAEYKISVAEGIKQAKDMFEGIKRNFMSLEQQPEQIHIANPLSNEPAWTRSLTSRLIASFFRPILEDFFAAVDSQIQQTPGKKIHAMIIAGGLGQSPYVVSETRKRWPEINLDAQTSGLVGDQVVVSGALSASMQSSFPSLSLQAHSESTYWRNAFPDTNVAVQDDCSKLWNLYDRWSTILEKGTRYTPGHTVKSLIWQKIRIGPDNKPCPHQFWYTEGDIKDHEPMLVQGRFSLEPGAQWRTDLEKWGDEELPKFPSFEELGDMGYKRYGTKNDPFYELHYIVKTVFGEKDISVSFQVARQEGALYVNGVFTPTDVDLLDSATFEIMSQDHNPVTQTAPS